MNSETNTEVKLAEWQPIETAIKDGTWVLLFTEHGVQAGYWGCSWSEAPGWIQYAHRSDQEDVPGTPTHWMPIPPPPPATPAK